MCTHHTCLSITPMQAIDGTRIDAMLVNPMFKWLTAELSPRLDPRSLEFEC